MCGDYDGDIRCPKWREVLAPLVGEDETIAIFNPTRVNSRLLIHVRLASRVMHRTTHVTAILRDDSTTPSSFRHYDNDSTERARGTYLRVTARELWINCVLYAIVKEDSPLHNAVICLPAISVFQDLTSPPRRMRGSG